MGVVTNKMQVLDSPFKKTLYSQNVWDMQLFNDKIYIGQGDSGVNAGPIPITSFDPLTDKSTNEFMVDDEQINAFKILNGKLIVPGHDPKEDWSMGNFYSLELNGWIKNRTIPKFIHTYDMEYHNGKLFAVGEINVNEAGIVMSDDFGKTWVSCGSPTLGKVGFVSLFVFKGDIYALANLSVSPYRDFFECEYVLKFDGSKFMPTITGDKMLPGLTRNMYQLEKFNTFNDKLLYIAVVGGFLRIPRNLFIAGGLESPVKVTFPEKTTVPTDIVIRGNKVYVLTYIMKSASSYTNIVYETSDLNTWTEVLRFDRETFARSFEEYDGVFYFGLGTSINTSKAPVITGQILRIRYKCPSECFCGLK